MSNTPSTLLCLNLQNPTKLSLNEKLILTNKKVTQANRFITILPQDHLTYIINKCNINGY